MILLTIIDNSEDRTKFCVIYEKYRYLLQKVAMDILHDRYLAEDAVQNAFLRIAGNIGKVGEVDSRQTKSYLIVIAKNAAIDICRKRNRQIQREINEGEVGEEKLPAVYMETDIENEVLNVLKNLPEKYRDVIYLHYYEGYSAAEMGRILKKKENTVYSLLSRGRAMLKEALGGDL